MENEDSFQTSTGGSDVHRKVSVKGSEGVSATVVVIARQGKVWVSIMPPFTWEAIMEPGKVDELIRTFGLAREDAKRMVSYKRVPHGDKQQPIGNGTVAALSTKQVEP